MVSDSSLVWTRKNRSGLLKNGRPDATFSVQSGATARDFVELLAGHVTREAPATLLWNLIDLVSTKGNVWRAVPEITAEFIGRLRAVDRELKQDRRALVVVGGFAEMWGLDSLWDDMSTMCAGCSRTRASLQSLEPFLKSIQSCLNFQQQHFIYSESLCQRFINFFDDCVHLLASATVDLVQRTSCRMHVSPAPSSPRSQ